MNALRTFARAAPSRTAVRAYSRNIKGQSAEDIAALGKKNGALFVRETAIATGAGIVCAGLWWVTITAPTQRAIDDYYGEYNRRMK